MYFNSERKVLNISKQEEILHRYYDMLFPGKLKEKEYVRMVMIKPPDEEHPDGVIVTKFVKSFNEYLDVVRKYRHNYHMYNSLCTIKEINGKLSGTPSYQRQRRVIYLDFDLKDFQDVPNADAYYFTEKIKSYFPNMFIHACYASGGGYHFYIAVKPTCDWKSIVSLNDEIVQIVGSDPAANKSTQIVRIPTSFNLKYADDEGKFPLVKEIVNAYDRHPVNGHKGFYETAYIKACITRAKRNSKATILQELPLQEFDYTSKDGLTNINQYPYLCNKVAYEQGVDKHERNTFMGRLIYQFLRQGKTEAYIHEEIQKWNLKCRPPKTRNEVTNEVNGWLKEKDMYSIGGCHWKINDHRVKAIVEKYCDKSHCLDVNSITLQPGRMVKVNKKLLTRNHLNKNTKESMSGYEYLILTVLDKYLSSTSKKIFTISDLKKRLMYKAHGKWQLCMNQRTFNQTIDTLIERRFISVTKPTKLKKKVTYNDYVVKITRRLKDFNDTGFIELYYSAAISFICKQITQNEYKILLCLIQQMEEHRSCSLDELSYILGIDRSNISKALKNLDAAQCIEIEDKKDQNNHQYNIYKHTDTNMYEGDYANDDLLENITIKISA